MVQTLELSNRKFKIIINVKDYNGNINSRQEQKDNVNRKKINTKKETNGNESNKIVIVKNAVCRLIIKLSTGQDTNILKDMSIKMSQTEMQK